MGRPLAARFGPADQAEYQGENCEQWADGRPDNAKGEDQGDEAANEADNAMSPAGYRRWNGCVSLAHLLASLRFGGWHSVPGDRIGEFH